MRHEFRTSRCAEDWVTVDAPVGVDGFVRLRVGTDHIREEPSADALLSSDEALLLGEALIRASEAAAS